MNSMAEDNRINHKQNDFAILVDSCCDVPEEFINKYPIYVVPLRINYKNASFRDRVDISPEEIYEKIEQEIPETSLPAYGDVKEIFGKIVKDGYNKVIAIHISSNLSGTFNLIRIVSEDMKETGVKTYLFDTKNIALASGMYALSAARHQEKGKSYEETIKLLEAEYGNSKVFFFVDTLVYLRKGGRIGRVASILGAALNMKPIITCGEDGTYIIAAKERGLNKCIEKAVKLTKDFADKGKNAEISVVHCGNVPEVQQIKESLEELIPGAKVFLRGQISPALGVHVGPGTVGIIVYVNDLRAE